MLSFLGASLLIEGAQRLLLSDMSGAALSDLVTLKSLWFQNTALHFLGGATLGVLFGFWTLQFIRLTLLLFCIFQVVQFFYTPSWIVLFDGMSDIFFAVFGGCFGLLFAIQSQNKRP